MTSPHTKGKVREGSRGKGKGKAPPEFDTLSLRHRVSSTRHVMYHHSDPFLSNFSAYLRSRPGGKRSEKVIRSLSKDVAKYLYFLDKERVRPELLLMKRPLIDYLKVLEEEYGIRYGGVLHKMDAITTALRFMSFSTLDEEGEEERDLKIERMVRFINSQRKRYKEEKTRSERKRLEELAANPPNLNGVADFLTDTSLTATYFKTSKKIMDTPLEMTRAKYFRCLAIVAGRILYRNSQRPSAICGLRVNEVEAARQQQEGGLVFYTICVEAHKTGKSERAKLVLNENMYDLLKAWMKVRNMIFPSSCPYVFPNYKGRYLTKLTSIVRKFAAKSGFDLPTCRVLRSAVEVKATCCPPAEKQAIARSLSHSNETAEKHYRALDQGKTLLAYRSVGSILGVPALSE
jgi:hypothetical protein